MIWLYFIRFHENAYTFGIPFRSVATLLSEWGRKWVALSGYSLSLAGPAAVGQRNGPPNLGFATTQPPSQK